MERDVQGVTGIYDSLGKPLAKISGKQAELSRMSMQDIHDMPSYEDYLKCLHLVKICIPEELRMLSLTKAFSLTLELGWKLIRGYLEQQSLQDAKLPKEVIRKALNTGIMTEADAQVWMDAFDMRTKIDYAYDEVFARKLAQDIEQPFLPTFESLEKFLSNSISKAR